MSLVSIGIVCALKEEAHCLLPHVKLIQKDKLGTFRSFQVKYNGKRLCLVISGMGTKNAAKAAKTLIDECRPACLINFGTAGGLTSNVEVGDVVVSSCAINYDFDPLSSYEGDSFLVQQAWSVPGVKKGVIVSADKNVTSLCQRQFLHKRYQALCCDWESATVLRVAQENKIPAIALRVISDVGTKQPLIEEFKANLPKVLSSASQVLLQLINKL